MKKDIKDLWVTTLRSGYFRQTSGRLMRNTDQFCVLGVLCNILFAEMNCVWEDTNYSARSFLGETAVLPKEVMTFCDIKTPTCELEYKGNKTSLTKLNDNGLMFSELADIIELNWENI